MGDSSDLDDLSEELGADALKDGFILDDWEVNTDFLQKNEVDRDLPWNDVEASRRNQRLQNNHRLPRGIRSHFAEAKPCPNCGSQADTLTWCYFRSPKETWAKSVSWLVGWPSVIVAVSRSISSSKR